MNDDVKKYHPRIVDKEIKLILKNIKALYIKGPKWCGKTSTALYYSKSAFFVNYEKPRSTLADLLEYAVEGKKPRLIDEWQDIPEIWDRIRHECDRTNDFGNYILTGSIIVDRKRISHSGIGRFGIVKMLPLSLYESEDSSGQISLSKMFNGSQKFPLRSETKLNEEKLADLIIKGGWPIFFSNQNLNSKDTIKQYMRLLIEEEIDKLVSSNFNKTSLINLLKSLSRNECTLVTNETLIKDISRGGRKISRNTLNSYIQILNRLLIFDNIEAFNLSLKSYEKIRRTEKRRFVDPSIACSLLGATKESLLKESRTLGQMFESLVIRDLHVYANSFDANLSYYKDFSNEIDLVIEHNGEWAGIEIKLGDLQQEKAVKSLLSAKKAIISKGGKEPKFLAIIVGIGDFAYRTPENIHVIPISMLKN